MNMVHFSDTDQAIGAAIIDAINDDGYLSCDVEELRQSVEAQGIELDDGEVEAVLHQIQNFDPIGVGARNLTECLVLQLMQLPENAPWRAEAIVVATEHLELLGSHDYARLVRLLGLSKEQLNEVIGVIQSLVPHPGALIQSAARSTSCPM